jgi:uncharacterized protein YdhG (YjbR/CyaY superfamily)
MDPKKDQPATVDEYIARCPAEIQPTLQRIRAVIREAAPQAQERIGYQMPGYYQHGALVWFGLHPHHVGFYPTGEGIEAFREELKGYKSSKGAVQFPLDQPMPYDLITKIVKHRLEVNLRESQAKQDAPARKRGAGTQ